MSAKQDLLGNTIEHIDITRHDVTTLVQSMRHMALSARDLARAADIYHRMLCDPQCGIILCMAGSLVSAGLKMVFVEMIRQGMVDGIVATGANIVDQDFFEAIGFKHYIADERLKAGLDDQRLLAQRINRIYDTLIDEDELCQCDDTVRQIVDQLPPRPYSSRELIGQMGAWLVDHGTTPDSIVLAAYENEVPIFCPAFSDCSAGFGLLAHQHQRGDEPRVSVDSAKDFYELSQLKVKCPTTGLLMIGGGVPKNFAQDIVVAAQLLGQEPQLHKYAVQITVADVRDGALSGSTLKEACSWGKVDTAFEQMVYSEATLALPLVVGYAYHQSDWKPRALRRWSRLLEPVAETVGLPPHRG